MKNRTLSSLPSQTRKQVTAELTALLIAKYGWPANHIEVTEADIKAFQPVEQATKEEIDATNL
jgi:hypothetical protein